MNISPNEVLSVKLAPGCIILYRDKVESLRLFKHQRLTLIGEHTNERIVSSIFFQDGMVYWKETCYKKPSPFPMNSTMTTYIQEPFKIIDVKWIKFIPETQQIFSEAQLSQTTRILQVS
jgi:hypothetical protein